FSRLGGLCFGDRRLRLRVLGCLVRPELGKQPGLSERGRHGVVDPLVRLANCVLGTVVAIPAIAALTTLGAILESARLARARSRIDRGRRSILGLLEAQAESMPLGVEADDLELENLALLHHVARVGDSLVGELADMDQALEALLHPDERTEVDE